MKEYRSHNYEATERHGDQRWFERKETIYGAEQFEDDHRQ